MTLFGGHDLTRRKTLMLLDDESLENYCKINKEAATHCNDEQFWKDRIRILLDLANEGDDKPSFLSYKITYWILSNYEKFHKILSSTRRRREAINKGKDLLRIFFRKLVEKTRNLTDKQYDELIEYLVHIFSPDEIKDFLVAPLIEIGRIALALKIAPDKHKLIPYLPAEFVKQIAQEDLRRWNQLVEEKMENIRGQNPDEDFDGDEAREMAIEELEEEDREPSPYHNLRDRSTDWPTDNLLAYIEEAKIDKVDAMKSLLKHGQYEAARHIYNTYLTSHTIKDFIDTDDEYSKLNLINFLLLYSIKFGYKDIPGSIPDSSMYLMERYKIFPTSEDLKVDSYLRKAILVRNRIPF